MNTIGINMIALSLVNRARTKNKICAKNVEFVFDIRYLNRYKNDSKMNIVNKESFRPGIHATAGPNKG